MISCETSHLGDKSFWSIVAVQPVAAPCISGRDNKAGKMNVWGPSPPHILQIQSLHQVVTFTPSHVPLQRRGIIITIFRGSRTNWMFPLDWDFALTCVCGPNFISYVILSAAREPSDKGSSSSLSRAFSQQSNAFLIVSLLGLQNAHIQTTRGASTPTCVERDLVTICGVPPLAQRTNISSYWSQESYLGKSSPACSSGEKNQILAARSLFRMLFLFVEL